MIPGPDSVQKMGPMFIGQSFNRTLVRWPGRFSCGNKNGGLGLGFCGAKISGGPLDLEPHRGVFEMGDMRCWWFLFVGLFR